jgi:hypothetical protein
VAKIVRQDLVGYVRLNYWQVQSKEAGEFLGGSEADIGESQYELVEQRQALALLREDVDTYDSHREGRVLD